MGSFFNKNFQGFFFKTTLFINKISKF